MSGLLRTAARRTASTVQNSFHTQKCHAGDLPVKANPYIEQWGTRRENVEHDFKFDKRSLTKIAIWAVAVPVFFYNVTTSEYRKSDKLNGKPEREFM